MFDQAEVSLDSTHPNEVTLKLWPEVMAEPDCMADDG